MLSNTESIPGVKVKNISQNSYKNGRPRDVGTVRLVPLSGISQNHIRQKSFIFSILGVGLEVMLFNQRILDWVLVLKFQRDGCGNQMTFQMFRRQTVVCLDRRQYSSIRVSCENYAVL